MKHLLTAIIILLSVLLSSGCSEYDDIALWNKTHEMDRRLKTVEDMCDEINSNVAALQTIVTALQDNDYIRSILPVTDNSGNVTGYKIEFVKSGNVTIYHGRDGQNGKDGTNGTDGKDGLNGLDGKDAAIPQIAIAKGSDGNYYWTLNGEWLLYNNGQMIRANGTDGKDGINGQDGKDGADGKDGKDGINGQDGKDGADGKDGINGQNGKDGITPQLKIENGRWLISVDNGLSWTDLGPANGADGKDGKDGKDGLNGLDGKDGQNGANGKDGKDGIDGESMFASVDYTSSTEYVIFTLINGEIIKFPTWAAFEQLRTFCNQLNTNIATLQTIVKALQTNDYIVSVTPLTNNGTEIGYTITFAKANQITIYHGHDGKDGLNGTDGKDGQNGADGKDGKDGYTPAIGVQKAADGILYWTLDGQWLTDESGKKIPVTGQNGANGQNGTDGKDGQNGQNGVNGTDGKDGKDGITPQFKIEDDYWFISYDDGSTWSKLGKATGADGKDGVNGTDGKDGLNGKDGVNGADGKDGQNGKDGVNGKDGDSLFSSIDISDTDFVIFTLSDGSQFKLPTWYAFEALKTFCNQINTNMETLHRIVDAMQLGDYIVSCTPLVENGKQIGYTLTFSKSGSVIIYHGKDGKDGQNGQGGTDGKDGQNGADGKDGVTPQIGAERDSDGILYWTINGDWLKDNAGKKIPVNGQNGSDGKDGQNGQNGTDGKDGKDGITPQFKIEDGYWFISYNDGTSWAKLGKATGADGKDGQNGVDGKDGIDGTSVFTSVRQDDKYVYVTLADSGEEIAIPKTKPFEISFDREEFTVQPGKTYTLKYTIKGGDSKTKINVYEKNGLIAEIHKLSNTTGTIEVSTPENMYPKSSHELIVMVNDGYDRTLMQTLTFVQGLARVTNYTTIANSDDTYTNVTLTTNLDSYTVEIPDDAKSWLSLAPQSRATMRDDLISFSIKPNSDDETRSAMVRILDIGGVEIEKIYVLQHGTTSKLVNVETAGKLSTLISTGERTKIEYLFVSGTVAKDDISFINRMTNLKYIDLSGISNTTLPCGGSSSSAITFTGTFETIILPKDLTKIPSYCFKNCKNLTSVIFPEDLQEIEKWAFYGCSNLTSLNLPKNLQTIGESAFSSCTGLSSTLVIPDNVTVISSSAFSECNKLIQVIIGEKVSKIEAGAFHCNILRQVYCKSTIPPSLSTNDFSSYAKSTAFGNCPKYGHLPLELYVPKNYETAYKQSDFSIFSSIKGVDFDKLGL